MSSLQSGFQPQKLSSTYVIEITNDTKNKVVQSGEFNVYESGTLAFDKPFGERTDEYSYNVYLNETTEPLVTPTKISITPFPIILIFVFIALLIFIIFIILAIVFLLTRRATSTSMVLVNETTELSEVLYEPVYNDSNISSYYEYLGLKEGTALKKVQAIYEKNLVKSNNNKRTRE